MKYVLVTCCVLLISACATSTGRENSNLGSGANKQVSPVKALPNDASSQTPGTAANELTPSNSANEQSPSKGGVSTGPVQSGGSPTQAQGTAPESGSATRPEIATQTPSDAVVTPLEGQESALSKGGDLTAPASATQDSPQPPTSSQSDMTEEQAAAAAAAAATMAESTNPTTESAATAKSANAASNAGSNQPGAKNAGADSAAEQHRSVAQDGEDPTVTGTVTEQQLTAAGPMLAERSVYYDFDKYDIKEQYVHIIEAHANFLVEHPTVKVYIEGNCDDRGSPEYNLVLGQRRAESVQKAMIALGVAAKQIESVSFGAERPMTPGHDEESWAKNRRSDIVYPMRNK